MSTLEGDALDQADMARLVAGQDLALNDLMERHAGALFGFLARFIRDEAAAQDLAQETFVRVYQHRDDFKSGQRFSTWLFTIGGNLARNHLRARSRRPEVSLVAGDDPHAQLANSLPAVGASPAEATIQGEQMAAVRSAVAALPEDLREAIVLCELEDRPVTEAAAISGATVKAVESRLYRARHLLRQSLNRWLTST